jgi:hypothetical protein
MKLLGTTLITAVLGAARIVFRPVIVGRNGSAVRFSARIKLGILARYTPAQSNA